MFAHYITTSVTSVSVPLALCTCACLSLCLYVCVCVSSISAVLPRKVKELFGPFANSSTANIASVSVTCTALLKSPSMRWRRRSRETFPVIRGQFFRYATRLKEVSCYTLKNRCVPLCSPTLVPSAREINASRLRSEEISLAVSRYNCSRLESAE